MAHRLHLRSKTLRRMVALALCAVVSQPHVAQPATATSNTAVTATVVANCTISSLPISFGNYDPVAVNASTALQAAGSVTIACTRGSAPTIAIGLGGNPNGSVRRMTDGASNFLEYEIYQPLTNAPGAACAYTTAWGSAGAALFTPTTPSSKAARTYSLCGEVPAGQDVPVGGFADSVVATVNF